MAYDFPASPITGQEVTGPGGIVYRWDGEKWVVISSTSDIALRTRRLEMATRELQYTAWTGEPTFPIPP